MFFYSLLSLLVLDTGVLCCCCSDCCSCSSSKLLVAESGFVLVAVDVFVVSVAVIYLAKSSLRAFLRDGPVFYRDAVV